MKLQLGLTIPEILFVMGFMWLVMIGGAHILNNGEQETQTTHQISTEVIKQGG